MLHRGNNLFDHGSDGYEMQLYNTVGLRVIGNTILNGSYGIVFRRDDRVPDGSGYVIANNIVQAAPGHRAISYEAFWGTEDFNWIVTPGVRAEPLGPARHRRRRAPLRRCRRRRLPSRAGQSRHGRRRLRGRVSDRPRRPRPRRRARPGRLPVGPDRAGARRPRAVAEPRPRLRGRGGPAAGVDRASGRPDAIARRRGAGPRTWSAPVGRPLGPGTYVVTVRATTRSGGRSQAIRTVRIP